MDETPNPRYRVGKSPTRRDCPDHPARGLAEPRHKKLLWQTQTAAPSPNRAAVDRAPMSLRSLDTVLSTPSTPPPQADLLYFTDIEHRPVEWLWPGRLAAGSLAILSGDPGSGKTWVALAIAAALSQGDRPGASAASRDGAGQPCTVLYASTPHLGSELIRPRFLALGGDPARLVLLRGIASSTAPTAISLRDTPILEDALARTHARLLILDPLHSYLAANERHRGPVGARAFDELAQLAEKHRCCILLVRHLRRRGRSPAAIELSAAVRTEFLVGSSPDAPARPALVQTKSNLAPLAPALGYRIDPAGDLASAFRWTGPSDLTADDLQRERPIGAGLPKRKQAAEWLRRHLSDGPLSQRTIELAALCDGLCMTTIRRAKQDIGVTSTKNNFNGVWYWELPPEEPASTDEPIAEEAAKITN